MFFYWIFLFDCCRFRKSSFSIAWEMILPSIFSISRRRNFSNIKCTDKYMQDPFKVANAQTQKLAPRDCSSSSAKLPDHFDFAVLDGYKFVDSEEDLVNKLVFCSLLSLWQTSQSEFPEFCNKIYPFHKIINFRHWSAYALLLCFDSICISTWRK